MNINYDSPFNFKPIPTITPASDYWENKKWRFNVPEITVGAGATPQPIDVTVKGIGAVTLVNAIDDGLLSLTLFGDTEQLPETYLDTVTLSGACEQRNLPAGHQQLNYLQGDGTAYIEADVVPTNNTGMKIVFEYATSGSAATSGVYDSVPPRQDTFFISTNSGSIDNSVVFTAHRGVTLNTSATYTEVPVQGKTYTIYINYKNSGTMGIEGFTQTNVGTDDVFSNKVLLFARLNYNNDNITASSDKIKYVEFTEGTEVIRKYYPDRYNNELGLYDTITNTFLTNKNSSGSFTAGADVTVPTPQQPLPINCNNGVVKVSPNLLTGQDDITQGYYLDDNGVATPTEALAYTNVYTEVNGGTYTFSGYGYGSYLSKFSAVCYDENKNVLGRVGRMEFHYNYSTFTTLPNTKYLRFNIPANTTSTSPLQLELGSTATTYMPYGQIYVDGTQEVVTDSVGNTASAERLLAVGDYKDTQEVLNGSVTRRIGIKVLDGTENWIVGGDNIVVKSATAAWGAVAGLGGFCTHLTVLKSNETTFAGACRFAGDFNVYEYQTAFGVNDLAGFKAFLADQYANGTPVIVVYPTNSATTELATPQVLTKSPVTQTAGSIDNLPIAITESSHTTPTPQQPLSIWCNNGVVKVSPNLYNSATRVNGYYISETGVITAEQNSAYSALIPVKPNTYYTYTGHSYGGNKRLHAYDSGGNWIQQINYASVPSSGQQADFSTLGQTPANCSYVRISGAQADTSVQLELGSTATPYRPYGQIYVDGTTETVEITGKNLFDVDNNLLAGYYINNSTGILTQSSDGSSSCFKDFLPSKPNVTYTMSRIAVTSTTALRMWAYDKDKNPISLVFNSQLGAVQKTGTTPAGTAYIRCSFGSIPQFSQNVQLELGSTATTYEPYYYGGQATAQNLFKIGTYQDVQSVIDGGVTRQIGIKVYDGSENWAMDSSSFYLDYNFNCAPLGNNQYCTHYNYRTNQAIYNLQNGEFYIWSNGNRIRFKDDRFSTVQQFVAWLANQYNSGNPVIVVYPLATATTETVTPQPMNIQAGTNIVEITQASMDNLELEVKYKAGVEVTITEIENAQLDDNVEVTING